MKEFKIRCSQIGKIMGESRPKGNLSATCITYLKEWYSEQMYGDREDIRSKYLDKGNQCEDEAISVVSERFDLLFARKNEKFYENDFMCGTPDLITDEFIVDTKCSWSGKTFLDSITSEINSDYEWQLQGYMQLVEMDKAKLCYVLLDTPEDANYGKEVIYSNLPINQRFYCFDVEFDDEKIKQIFDKVKQCRDYLYSYDIMVKSKLHA